MRAVRLLSTAVIFALMTSGVAFAAAPTVSSAELVERASEWDGKRVTFTGEAIGSAMERGEVAWLHINDDEYASSAEDTRAHLKGYNSGQAILVSTELAELVEHLGSFGERGDIITVEGVFHAADPRFGGDMLIEADSLRVARTGGPVTDPVPTWKLLALAALAAAATISYQALLWRRRGKIMGHRLGQRR